MPESAYPTKSQPENKVQTIRPSLYLTYIVSALYRKYPETEFAYKVLSYSGRRSLRISWLGLPLKKEVERHLEMYRGANINSEGVLEPIETVFGGPEGKLELINYGFDFIICDQKELSFI
jgi:hypothetical protein